jgi:hemoglobin-like flavoprotein
MIPAQKQIIRATWAQVVPIADQAAVMFYQRLFQIDPTTRPLFDLTDMAQQRKKLLQVLGVAVSSLDNLGALVKTVEDLGRRHAGYGVKDQHYDSVGTALLWTLEQGLGKAWTPEAAAAWTEVYKLLSGIMRRAQQDAALGITRPAA